MLFVTCRNQVVFYTFIFKVGDTLRRIYVKIFLKGPVGLFQKCFANISVVNKIFKKQVQIKELENRDEAKRKARSYFKRIFHKKEKKTSGKARNKNIFLKQWSKCRADSSAYDNLLHMHILLLKRKKQPLADVLYFSDVL